MADYSRNEGYNDTWSSSKATFVPRGEKPAPCPQIEVPEEIIKWAYDNSRTPMGRWIISLIPGPRALQEDIIETLKKSVANEVALAKNIISTIADDLETEIFTSVDEVLTYLREASK